MRAGIDQVSQGPEKVHVAVSANISGVGKYEGCSNVEVPGRVGQGMIFPFGADLTVALWVSGRPRQKPQPWPIMSLRLPLGTVRTSAKNMDVQPRLA